MPKVLRTSRLALCLLVLALCGCTSVRDYVRQGLKVGPQYATPLAPVANHWIDANDVRLRSESADLSLWWQVFDDPMLNQLIVDAYQQNLTLREAGFRILAARAQYGIAVGNFFPQIQNTAGTYQRSVFQEIYSQNWSYGFNLAWELDFWGRFRRAIISAEATLDASVFNYDDVLVTLLGDVASAYVQIRTIQRRIQLLEYAIRVQQDVYNFIDVRLKEGYRLITELDRAQAEANLRQSEAQIKQFRIDLRQAENGLCVLLGRPSVDLEPELASAPKTDIPIPPDYATVGIPADLLRRRPDVRRAERVAAAQCELIGIAVSDLYPAFTVSGNMGWQNASVHQLFKPGSFVGSVNPSFQWNVLNYGRLVNNIRLQDATFNALVVNYQNTVVQASAEVENGIVQFLQAQDRARLLNQSVDASYRALGVVVAQYEAGAAGVDFNRYAVILQSLITQQDSWAVSQGQIGQGLINVYRGLGGGWQIRLAGNANNLRFLPPVNEPAAFGPQVVPPGELLVPPMPQVIDPNEKQPEAIPVPEVKTKAEELPEPRQSSRRVPAPKRA